MSTGRRRFTSTTSDSDFDVDHSVGDSFRVVQLTPHGSACSITIGKGLQTGEPGSVKGLQIVVEDIEAARTELVDRGVDAGDFFHFGEGGETAGLHPERETYGSFFSFGRGSGRQRLARAGGQAARSPGARMSGAALALALSAAVLHALWNLLLGGSRDVLAATAVALSASLGPRGAVRGRRRGTSSGRPCRGWSPPGRSSALLLHADAAYARAELSLVYPLARGGAPVLVLLGALATGVVPSGREARESSRSRSASCSCAAEWGRPARRRARADDRGADRRLHARRRRGDRVRRAGAVLLLALIPTAVGATLVVGP